MYCLPLVQRQGVPANIRAVCAHKHPERRSLRVQRQIRIGDIRPFDCNMLRFCPVQQIFAEAELAGTQPVLPRIPVVG